MNITQSRLARLELKSSDFDTVNFVSFFWLVSPPDSLVGWVVPDSILAQDLVNDQVVDETIQAPVVFDNPAIELPVPDPECAPTYVDICPNMDMPLSEGHDVAGSSLGSMGVQEETTEATEEDKVMFLLLALYVLLLTSSSHVERTKGTYK